MFQKELILPKNQNGQALLIVILVMVVALTVGLSVATRTITNLRNTNEEENSQKALSAAEAGIERTIKSGAAIPSDSKFSGDTTYKTTYDQASSNSFLLSGGNSVPKNDATYVWLSPYSPNPANLWKIPWPPGGGSSVLRVSWGTSGQSCAGSNKPPAVEVAIVSGTSNTDPNMNIKRYTFDPCARATGFTTSGLLNSHTVSGVAFNYQTPASGAPNAITVSNGLLARIDLIYSSSQLGITGVGLPAQGITITSIGSTGTSDKTTRKITVFQGYPEIPAEFFPYTLFQP